MPTSNDLEAALSFVTRRIEEEAIRGGEPLDAIERMFLHEMPEDPIAPPPLDEFSGPAPRNLAYEKLCAMAKAAYRNDSETPFESDGVGVCCRRY